MICEVQVKSEKKRKFIEYILPSIFSQLKIKSKKFSLFINTTSVIDDEALTVALPECGVIVLSLHSRLGLNRLGLALCHEMVHVKQMTSGILWTQSDGNFWAGKFFSHKTPYLERPWELQAYSKQEIIFRKAIQ